MIRPPAAQAGRKAARVPQIHLQLEVLEARNLFSVSNVLVNNVAEDTTSQDTQSETSIVLGANGTVVVGFNDSEENVGGANHFTGFSRSTNGGTTFTDQGALPANSNGDAGDPSLAVNSSTGTIYLSTLSFGASNRIQFFKSTNNGVSFGPPVNSAPGFSTSDLLDKDWITVDNSTAPGAGHGNIYQAFTDFGSTSTAVYLTRSTNGGTTWSAGVKIGGMQGGNVVVGPDHSVYVFAFNGSNIIMRKSTNQGASFGPQIVVTTLKTTGVNGDLGLGFRTNAFPQAAVNAANGDLYVVYDDKGTSPDRCDVFMRESTNGGTTWSAAVKLNDDHTTHDQFMPAIAVTPDGTHLVVTWYDRRLDPNNKLIDRFGALGNISGHTVTFVPNARITTASFPAVFGQDPAINGVYMGDYDVVTADNSFFYTTWGDNRLKDHAHLHNPDVRFAKLPVTGFGPRAIGANVVALAAAPSGAASGTTLVGTDATAGAGRASAPGVSFVSAAPLAAPPGRIAPPWVPTSPTASTALQGFLSEDLWRA